MLKARGTVGCLPQKAGPKPGWFDFERKKQMDRFLLRLVLPPHQALC